MPRKYEVIISAQAHSDIDLAYQWIAESDEGAAERWYKGIINAIGSLGLLPLRRPVAPEFRLGLTDRQVRQLLSGTGHWKYRILFAVEGKRVMILHVRHGARLRLGEESSHAPD